MLALPWGEQGLEAPAVRNDSRTTPTKLGRFPFLWRRPWASLTAFPFTDRAMDVADLTGSTGFPFMETAADTAAVGSQAWNGHGQDVGASFDAGAVPMSCRLRVGSHASLSSAGERRELHKGGNGGGRLPRADKSVTRGSEDFFHGLAAGWLCGEHGWTDSGR